FAQSDTKPRQVIVKDNRFGFSFLKREVAEFGRCEFHCARLLWSRLGRLWEDCRSRPPSAADRNDSWSMYQSGEKQRPKLPKSTVAHRGLLRQPICKPLVGGSNPSPGTN